MKVMRRLGLCFLLQATLLPGLGGFASGIGPFNTPFILGVAHAGESAIEVDSTSPKGGRVIRVRAGATGSNDGTSWENAYPSIIDAVEESVDGDELWISSGVYKARPSGVGVSLSLFRDIKLYGGFTGTEVFLSDRPSDWRSNPVILSGDLEDNTDSASGNGDPSREDDTNILLYIGGDVHIERMIIQHTRQAMLVAGNLTMQECLFRWNVAYDGAACSILYGTTVLKHVHFLENQAQDAGGAIQIRTTGIRSVLIDGCVFDTNTARFGGAVDIFYLEPIEEGESFEDSPAGSVEIRYSEYRSNHAEYGGAVSWLPAEDVANSLVMRNNKFLCNSATLGAGALGIGRIANDELLLTGCLFVDNAAPDAAFDIFSAYEGTVSNSSFIGNLSTTGDPITFPGLDYKNCIIWDNGPSPAVFDSQASFKHCLVEDSGGSGPGWKPGYGTDGGGNLDVDPLFTLALEGEDPCNRRYDLQIQSPAVDAGLVEEGDVPTTDLDGNVRPYGASIDMGAYELVWGVPELAGDFAALDANGDGLVSAAEMQSTWRVSLPYAESVVQFVDVGNDGSISVAEALSLLDAPLPPLHRADKNGNRQLELDELLRVIQLYNNGSYHCAANAGATEDGYDLQETTNTPCPSHSADYAPADWSIGLSELLRLVQLYSLGGYQACPEGEDGFCGLTT